ncbi:MAG: hypothetical protein JRH20_03475 [Deltaproteobacteria bacterium]|nr:hypothetical protein [Deltaproteobacteria bacterium]
MHYIALPMNVLIRKYFWTLNLLVISICAYLLASAGGQLLLIKMPIPKRRVARSNLGNSAGLTGRTRDVSGILARNIFCSECEPEQAVVVTPAAGAGDEGAPKVGGEGEAVKSTLGHKLIVTLVSEQDKAWSYAALFDPSDNKTRIYSIGQKIFANEARLVDILSRRVLLQREGRNEYIDLDDGSAPKRGAPRPKAAARSKSPFGKFASEISKGVRNVGPNKWEIQRSALNKVLGNTTMLARSARIVPSVRNGKPNGFKLYAIRPGSVYSLIGMQNGDTIHAINGHAITTPDKALAVYTKIRTASHLTISFSRRGKPQTNDYTIR